MSRHSHTGPIYIASLLKGENLSCIVLAAAPNEPNATGQETNGEEQHKQGSTVSFIISAPWTRCGPQLLMKHAVGYQRLQHNSQFYLENESSNRLVSTCSWQKHGQNKPNKSAGQSPGHCLANHWSITSKVKPAPPPLLGRPNSGRIDYVHSMS